MYGIELAIRIFAKFPKLAGILGLLVTIIFGFLGVKSWIDLQNLPKEPELVSLSGILPRIEKGEEPWVEIEGAKWDCGNIIHSGLSKSTEIVFTNEDLSILGVAEFSGNDLLCKDFEEKRAIGILRPMSQTFYERLTGRGFDISRYQNATVRLYLCAYCGRSNSMLGVVLSLLMALLGLTMYPLSFRLRKYYEQKGLL